MGEVVDKCRSGVGYAGVIYFFFFLSFFLSFLSSLPVGRGAGWLDRVGNIGAIGRGRVVLEWFDGVGIVGVDTTEGGF